MKLVEFLIETLHAHAQTLQRLAALVGEERLINLLENETRRDPASPPIVLNSQWFVEPASTNDLDASVAYRHLEGAVHELKLPATLEFHLWAYPYYRLMIESPIHLHSRIVDKDEKSLIDEAIRHAQIWFASLLIPAALQPQAQRAAEIPWIRFRATLLKKMGRRLFVSL